MSRAIERMRYRALASDYDGTLAEHGAVDAATYYAIARLIRSGRDFILVTGRELPDLQRIFPHLGFCTRVVAENGAILYDPASGRKSVLAERPPDTFIELLRRHGVYEFGAGEVIVGTKTIYQQQVADAIRDSGLPLEMTLNKESIMILPAGINKASGLRCALSELGIDAEAVVAIGDAENDHAFLDICGCCVAVSNAIPAVKDRAHIVTERACGGGVVEIIERIIATDLAELHRPEA